MVSLVSNLASDSKQPSQTKNIELPTPLEEDRHYNNTTQQLRAFARSMSDSGFESKESEKLQTRRGTEIQPSKLSLSQARRKKFQERAAEKRRSRGSSVSYFELPDLKFRNFTNIFGSNKKERRGSRQEKVTLQSIMKKSFATGETAE